MVDIIKMVKKAGTKEYLPYVALGIGALGLIWYLNNQGIISLGQSTPVFRINPIPIFQQTPVYQMPESPLTYRADIGRAAPYLGWSPETPHF